MSGPIRELTEASVAFLLEHRGYPGCTMASLTIRERLEAIEDAARADAPPVEPVGPTCVLCPWSQDIGHEAHAAMIHPDADLIVIEQMGQKFIVRRPASTIPRRGWAPEPTGLDESPAADDEAANQWQATYPNVSYAARVAVRLWQRLILAEAGVAPEPTPGLRDRLIRELDARIPPMDWPNDMADKVLAAIDAALAASSAPEPTPGLRRWAFIANGTPVPDGNGKWVKYEDVAAFASPAPEPTGLDVELWDEPTE